MEPHRISSNLLEIKARTHPQEVYLFSKKDQGYLRRLARLEKKVLSIELGGIIHIVENPFIQCLEF